MLSRIVKGCAHAVYIIKGCSYALLLWAYEHIPSWRLVDMLADPDPVWPRILKWTSTKYRAKGYYEEKLIDETVMNLTPTTEELAINFISLVEQELEVPPVTASNNAPAVDQLELQRNIELL